MDGGHLEAIEALLRGGAPADQTFPGGATPLYLAALTGRTKMIDLLVNNGAAVDEELTIDAHPTTLGCWGLLPRMLYERGLYKFHSGILRPVTALLVASAGDHADAVRSLLKAGAALDGNSTKDEDDAKDDNDDNDDNDDESNNDEEGGDTGRGKDGGGDWREWAETRALGGDPGRGAMDDDFWVQADLDPVAEGGWRRVPERGGAGGRSPRVHGHPGGVDGARGRAPLLPVDVEHGRVEGAVEVDAQAAAAVPEHAPVSLPRRLGEVSPHQLAREHLHEGG